MKSFFVTSCILFAGWTSQADTSVMTLHCFNEAHSLLTAKMQIGRKNIKLAFGTKGDGSLLENEIKNKKLTLSRDLENHSEGYLVYIGEVLTSRLLHEFREVQVSILKSNLQNSAEKHLKILISNSYGAGGSPSGFVGYGMICEE